MAIHNPRWYLSSSHRSFDCHSEFRGRVFQSSLRAHKVHLGKTAALCSASYTSAPSSYLKTNTSVEKGLFFFLQPWKCYHKQKYQNILIAVSTQLEIKMMPMYFLR